MVKFSDLIRPLLFAVLWDASWSARCFCTSKQPICSNPVCDSAWCIVGFKNEIDLVQKCANATTEKISGCTTNWQDWQEVCSCRKDFCNTFAFLREYTINLSKTFKGRSKNKRRNNVDPASMTPILTNDDYNRFEQTFNQKRRRHRNSKNDKLNYDDDSYDYIDNDDGSSDRLRRRKIDGVRKINLNRTQQLAILLIILPLGLGAATVTLIFINYHCKMCN